MSFPLTQRPRSYSMTHMNNAQALNADSECAQPCMHHPIAPQYPNGNAVKHLADLSEFVKTVAEGLERIVFPRPQQRYSSVHVLMISWEDDDLGTAREIAILKDIFEEDYRYSTRHYEIPSHKKIPPGSEPSWELEEVLVQTRNKYGRDEDGLLIIYYGGHGEVSKRSQHSIWKAWKSQPIGDRVPPTSPEIDWSESQAMVMGAKAEILFVLDCCYASASVRDFGQRYRGRRELLLASGNDKASNENTLTKALIYELRDLDASPCTVSSLHARLLQNQSKHNLKPAPIYTCMVGAKAGIVLAPLPDPNAPTSSTPQETVIPDADRKTLLSPCQVLISVSLTEIGGQSIRETWMEWFRDHAPPNVGAVNFFPLEVTRLIRPVATFDSNSSYLIFLLPMSVWNVMTPNPAINLLSIVRSGNLIHRHAPILLSYSDALDEWKHGMSAFFDRISELEKAVDELKDSNKDLEVNNYHLRAAVRKRRRRSPSQDTLPSARMEDSWVKNLYPLSGREPSPPNPGQAKRLEHFFRRHSPAWLSDLRTDPKSSKTGSISTPRARTAGMPTYSISSDSAQLLPLRGTSPAEEESSNPAAETQKPVPSQHEQPGGDRASHKRGAGEGGSHDERDDAFVSFETIDPNITKALLESHRESSGDARTQHGIGGKPVDRERGEDDLVLREWADHVRRFRDRFSL